MGSGASFVFLFLFLHLGRAMFYGSYFYNPKYLVFRNCSPPLLNGYSIYGLCLTFWTNEFLGSYSNYKFIISFPSLIEWVSGGYCVHSPTLKRFFIFHFQLSFLLCGFAVLHLFYLHFLSSNNPLRNSTNNKIPFFPFIFQKDFFGLILI